MNKSLVILGLIAGMMMIQSPARSQTMVAESSTKEALEQVQKLLKNQVQRQTYIKENAPAQEADKYAKDLVKGNSVDIEELYAISASVFEVVVQKSGGDSKRMELLLQKYSDDPESFYKDMTPDQQERIQKLGRKLSSQPQKP